MTKLDAADRSMFEKELREAPCTREAIDKIFDRYYPEHRQSCRYPDEWYADKDSRLAGKDTGHLRHTNGKMVWVPHFPDAATLERKEP